MEKITIQFSFTDCTILSDISEDLNLALYEELSYHPVGYFFSPKYQDYKQALAMNMSIQDKGLEPPYNLNDFTKYWDGFVRLYRPGTKKFRVGLLSRVTKFLTEKQGVVEVEVLGKPSNYTFEQHTNTYTLRNYQWSPVHEAIEKRVGIIKSPPRSGKTVMAVAITDSEEKFPTIFLCRSLDLVKQAKEEFTHFLSHTVGKVADGEVDIQDITIMTVQSVYSAYDKKLTDKDFIPEKAIENKLAVKRCIENAKIVFYDEAHHGKSETSRFVLDKCKKAEMKIGFSATPSDDKDNPIIIENVLGPLLVDIGYSALIRDGYLLRPYIYMYKLPKNDAEGNYKAIYKQEVVENEFLEGLIVKLVNKLNSIGESVVVQTEYISHSKRLAKAIGCKYLTGNEKSEERTRVITALKEKKILALVSTLFEEGLDIPSLGYTINVAGNLSNITTLQRMRSITAMEGKDTCGIIDFYHQCKYLHKHSLKRKRLYKSEPEFVYTERDVSKKTLEEIK